MSNLVSYIQSLDNTTFSSVKAHFLEKGCRVFEEGDEYMVVAPSDFSVFSSESSSFLSGISHAVGTILSKESNKVLSFGFPKTQEILPSQTEPSFSKKIIASEYIDGSLLRAHWNGTLWKLTTNGSINAYESFWISSQSFGELFDDCLSRIFKKKVRFATSPLVDHLDRSCCYQFLIQHPSVHLDRINKPFIYHAGTYNLENLQYISTQVLKTIHRPRIHNFSSLEEAQSFLYKNTDFSGFILYNFSNAPTQTPRYKLFSDKFRTMKALIGNTPNMYLRYLECKYEGKAGELLHTFPSVRFYSSWVEKSLDQIVQNAYDIYVEKFILKINDVFINFFYRPIIQSIHAKFLEMRALGKAKITPEIVSQIIRAFHPKRLNFILNGLEYIQTSNVYNPTSDKDTPQHILNKKKAPQRASDEAPVSKEDPREKFGNILYPKIQAIVGSEKAPKICGMLLEMDEKDLKDFSENESSLREVVEQANTALETSEQETY